MIVMVATQEQPYCTQDGKFYGVCHHNKKL